MFFYTACWFLFLLQTMHLSADLKKYTFHSLLGPDPIDSWPMMELNATQKEQLQISDGPSVPASEVVNNDNEIIVKLQPVDWCVQSPRAFADSIPRRSNPFEIALDDKANVLIVRGELHHCNRER